MGGEGLTPEDKQRGKHLRDLRRLKGWTQIEVTGKAGLGERTLERAEKGQNMTPKTATGLARVYDVSLEEILTGVPQPERVRETKILEWVVQKPTGPWLRLQNGIQWRVCVLHDPEMGRRRRAKQYDLSDLNAPDKERAAVKEKLFRHGKVTDLVGKHPNLAENREVFADPRDSDLWWVLDEWVGDSSLDEVLRNGPLVKAELSRCMRGVALGLSALHAKGVVMRTLEPRCILWDGEKAVVTDFELSKLSGSVPTVAPKHWAASPYLAPEARGGAAADPKWDVFSWGMVFAHAASGHVPSGPSDATHALAKLPERIRALVVSCVGNLAKRPKNMEEVARALPEVWR